MAGRMLARRLIPCLNLASQAPAQADPRQAWTTLARQLEDQGADELLISVAGLPVGSQAAELLEAITSELSIGVIAEGGTTLQELELLVRAGASAVVVDAAHTELIVRAERAWGRAMVAAMLRYAGSGDPVPAAIDVASAGARELIVDAADPQPRLLKSISEATSIPILASGPMRSLEQVRTLFVEGRADAAILSAAWLNDRHGVSEVKRYLAAAGIVVRGVN